jgi:hypothetical protein
MKKRNTTFLAIALCAASLSSEAQAWKLVGNAGTTPGTNFVGTTDNKALVFKTKNIERMRIAPNGRVGIGTTSPQALLNIPVSGNVTLTGTDNFLLGSTSSSNIAFDNNEIQARFNGSGSTLYLNYWGGALWLGNHSGSAIPGVYVNSNGAVGIGNSATNSAYALTINPSSAGNGILFNDPVNGYMAFGAKSGSGIGMLIENTSSSNSSPAVYGYNSGPGYGVYGYTAGGSGSDPFYPSGVYGYNGSTGYGVGGYCNSGSGVLGYSANYVGVWGSTGNSSSYAGFFSGDVFSTGSYLGSDQKLKQNIQDFSSAMDIISQLHPKKYNYRQDGTYKLMNLPKGSHFGLIAQDVEKVLPNLVKQSKFQSAYAAPAGKVNADGKMDAQPAAKSETVDFKAVNYTELIPIMIKAMQELKSTVDAQQQKIAELENTITSLKNGNPATSASSTNVSVNPKIAGMALQQNAPNPFNQNTVIQYSLPASSRNAQLVVFDMSGHQLKSYSLSNGSNQVTIDGGSLSSGQYIYSLIVDGKKVASKNMMLTK